MRVRWSKAHGDDRRHVVLRGDRAQPGAQGKEFAGFKQFVTARSSGKFHGIGSRT
jgi:hypothetical protein